MIQEIEAKLKEKKNLAPAVWLFNFELSKPESLNFQSGQYLLLKINQLRRAYSIASLPSFKDSFELLVKLVPGGVGSTFFENLEVGQSASFLGPLGFFILKSKEGNKVFLAGGTGIAPVRSQILSLLKGGLQGNQPDLFLFWGLKTKNDVYFFEEFKNLSQNFKNFNFKICLDEEQNFQDLDKNYFYQGRVQTAFLDFLKNSSYSITESEYYLCGPPQMVEALKVFLSEQGVKKENIFFEKF